MDGVNNLARWWNNEGVVPSLRTSLCIVSTPGAFLVSGNITNLMSVWASISFISSCSSLVSNLVISVFRRIKIFMIILYELVDFIGVIQIKVFALNPKVSFNRFGKELFFVSICLGDFVVVAQCWIVTLTLWLEEVLDFVPRVVLVNL